MVVVGRVAAGGRGLAFKSTRKRRSRRRAEKQQRLAARLVVNGRGVALRRSSRRREDALRQARYSYALGRLLNRGHITMPQWQAGLWYERQARDYHRAIGAPHLGRAVFRSWGAFMDRVRRLL
jgi:hypothetical protein